MENKIVNLQVNDNIDETTKSVVSLKTQLRLAQQEVAELSDKFGDTSREAVEAAKKAAILKDRIGDAKALTDAFNPDAKFNALSSSLGGVASGFAAYQGAMGLVGVESKDLEKQLLKVQSAMAIAEGLQGLGEARDSFKQLKAVGVNAFNAIKTAIGSTGIGLIVIAAGAIYAYWDDIKEAVSSVSAEQKNLNALSKRNLEQEQQKLDTIGGQDNILKLQGKSEKDILKIKIAQTDQVIKASEVQIEQSIATAKAQTEAARRNQDILAGVLKFISIPLTLLLKTVDSIGKALGKDFGLEDKVFGGLSSLMFDPVKVKQDGDAVVAEQRKALEKLKNDRAGLQLSINSIDRQASETSKAERVKNETAQKEADDKIKEKAAKDQEEFNQFQIKISEAKSAQNIADMEAKENKINDLFEIADAVDNLEAKNTQTLAEDTASRIELAKKEKEAKIQAAEAASATLSGLSELLGKETAAGKAAAVASATISTFLSAQKAYESTVGIPFVGPILAPINAALAIAGGIKSVKSILAVKTPSGGGGGGSVPSMPKPATGVMASSTPTAAAAPSFNVVGTSGQNQIAQSLGNQAPVKAYVVSGDVTTAQSLDRNIVKTASLGN
jgi:hypothetical protein